MGKRIIWSIKELIEILKSRQVNEFDANILVSGDRGNGKSTLIYKLLARFKNFNPIKHQVYSRDEVIKLLKTQKHGICWDDEAVNSGYKRNFQETGQKELIKIVTMYRDHFNIYFSAIPNFFSLDKDLRDLIFMHIHIVERGIAIIHMPLQGRLYSLDRWDSKNNARIENGWIKRFKKNADFKPPFYRLSTFRGYLFFGDLTEKQKEKYLRIKHDKRKELYGDLTEEIVDDTHKDFYDLITDMLLAGTLTNEILLGICRANNKKFTNVKVMLNRRLKDRGIKMTTEDVLRSRSSYNPDGSVKSSHNPEKLFGIPNNSEKNLHSSVNSQISSIVPAP